MSSASVDIPGYTVETDLRRDRTDTRNGIGGGLLVYSKQGMEILPCDDDIDFNQYCKFKVATRGGHITIILIYRPPSSGTDNTRALCDLLQNADKDCYLIGDFNLPSIDWAAMVSDNKGRQILKTSIDRGLTQLTDFSTHEKGNILDLMLTDCPEKVIAINEIGKLGSSDHFMIELILDVQTTVVAKQSGGKCWNRANFDAIRSDLREEDWDRLKEHGTVEGMWVDFRLMLSATVNKNVPDWKPGKSNRPRWLTKNIKDLLEMKKRKWRIHKKKEGGIKKIR